MFGTLGALGHSRGGTSAPSIVPSGALIGIIGDSIDEFNFNTGTGSTQRATGLVINAGAGGELIQALAMDARASLLAWNDPTDSTGLLGNTGRYYSSGDVGRAGATLADILAEIPRVAAYKPSIVIASGGTNALLSGTFQADHAAILDAVHAALPNCIVGVVNIRQPGPTQAGANGRSVANVAVVNALILANVNARYFCKLIDMTGYADGAAGASLTINYATLPYQSGSTTDDLHPGPFGAQQHGAPAYLKFLQNYVGPGNAITARKISSVLTGSIALNGGTSAVSHTATTGGGTITGNVPTSMDVALGSNANVSNCVCSLEANSETGGQNLVLTITPLGTATQESFIIRPSAIALATTALQNQWARMWCELEVDQGAGWLTCVLISQERSNNANNFHQAFLSLYPLGAGTRRLYPVTPPLQYVAGSTGFDPAITVKFNPNAGAGPYVLKLRQWDMQTEASPVRP